LKKIIILGLILFLTFLGKNVFGATNIDSRYSDLAKKLKQQKYSDTEIKKILTDKRIKHYPDILKSVKKNDVYFCPDSEYFTEESIAKGKNFLAEYGPLLEEAEVKYKVEKEIITGVFRMESNFGNYLGKHKVMNTYLTMIYYDFKTTYVDKKTGRIKVKEWKPESEKQIISFLRICRKNNIDDPYEVDGSRRGAFGLVQFIPTSYEAFAVDGNGDGIIDLFNIYDAVPSAANYLKQNGWEYGVSINAPFTTKHVIWIYNNWMGYVKAVVIYALMIKNSTIKIDF